MFVDNLHLLCSILDVVGILILLATSLEEPGQITDVDLCIFFKTEFIIKEPVESIKVSNYHMV